ncbi:MAG: GNAT family N-acetyltransferase [Methanolinea sp.]|nr:GNAT family N-acetyltransferase [Methanolinea sp.]
MVTIVKEWDTGALMNLYRAGGWWKEEWDPVEIPRLVRSTFAFVVAVDRTTKETVGMGRAISDGVSDAYIQDLVVLPAFRGRGIGRAILEKLVDVCRQRGITWIALVAEPGTADFYRCSGFEPMEGHVPMHYRGKEGVC